MSEKIQNATTGRLAPCLEKKIDKTTYLVELHFNETGTQSAEDKLKRVIPRQYRITALLSSAESEAGLSAIVISIFMKRI